MIPISEVESYKNELAKRKENFTHQLQVSTKISTLNVEIWKRISITPTQVLNRDISLSVTNGKLIYYNNLRNERPLEVLTIQILKQDFHFRPHYRLAQFRLCHIKPKQINRKSIRSGQNGGKISND